MSARWNADPAALRCVCGGVPQFIWGGNSASMGLLVMPGICLLVSKPPPPPSLGKLLKLVPGSTRLQYSPVHVLGGGGGDRGVDACGPNGFGVLNLGYTHGETSPRSQQGQGSCVASKKHCVRWGKASVLPLLQPPI